MFLGWVGGRRCRYAANSLQGAPLRSPHVDARWPQLAAQLMAAGLRYDQALQMLGLIDNEGRLLPRDDDQHA